MTEKLSWQNGFQSRPIILFYFLVPNDWGQIFNPFSASMHFRFTLLQEIRGPGELKTVSVSTKRK
jgi:hypothetical protein